MTLRMVCMGVWLIVPALSGCAAWRMERAATALASGGSATAALAEDEDLESWELDAIASATKGNSVAAAHVETLRKLQSVERPKIATAANAVRAGEVCAADDAALRRSFWSVRQKEIGVGVMVVGLVAGCGLLAWKFF